MARELTLSFVPDVEQHLLRTVTRKKYQLRCDRIRLQNQVESLLEEAHIKLSSFVSDLLGLSARRMLKALADGKSGWPDIIAGAIIATVNLVRSVGLSLPPFERRPATRETRHPASKWDPEQNAFNQKVLIAMSQISPLEADALLSKLLSERIPLHAFFKSASEVQVRISGFVDNKADGRFTFSTSGPPIDVERGYISVPLSGRDCKFSYGEKRELSEDLQRTISDRFGDSALVVDFPESGEWLSLFFTI